MFPIPPIKKGNVNLSVNRSIYLYLGTGGYMTWIGLKKKDDWSGWFVVLASFRRFDRIRLELQRLLRDVWDVALSDKSRDSE